MPPELDSPLGVRQCEAIEPSRWTGNLDAPDIDSLQAALGRAAPARAPAPNPRGLPRPVPVGLATAPQRCAG